MTAPISESWTRIDNWLAEHAPATYTAPAPPADPVDIAAAERVIGRPLLKPLVVAVAARRSPRPAGLAAAGVLQTDECTRDSG